MNRDIDWAIKQKAPHTCKHILLILANRANKLHQCFPSLTSITQDTGLDRRTVMRSLTILEELLLITRQKRGIDTTLYTLKVGAQRHHSGENTREGIVGAESPYQQGQDDSRGTAPLGAERHQGRGIDDTKVGAQCPTEPKREPKLNPKTGIVDRSDRKTKPPGTIPITQKHRDWAAKNGVKVDLEKETEQMLDHFRGKGETRLDWEATWRTWMRNSITFGRNGGNGHGGHRETDFEKNNRALKAQLNSVLAPTLNWDLPDVREDDG